MGRPSKNNAEYYPHFTTMRNHRKVKILRNKFGIVLGYAFWCMMLEWLSEQDGLEWEYSDLECEMFAAELGVSAAEIRSLVDFCLQIELLFKSDTGFIYSESLNEYLQPLFEKRRKSRDISKARQRRENRAPKEENPVVNGVSATETPPNTQNSGVSVAEMPQSKVKESKVDNSKEKKASADAGFNGLDWDQSYLKLPEKPEEEKEKGSAQKEKEEVSQRQWEKRYCDAWWEFYKTQNKDEEPPHSWRNHYTIGGPLNKIQQDLVELCGSEELAYQEFVSILSGWQHPKNYHRNRLKPIKIHENLVEIRKIIREPINNVTTNGSHKQDSSRQPAGETAEQAAARYTPYNPNKLRKAS